MPDRQWLEVRKLDEAERLVFGWASVAVRKDGSVVVDVQGDVIAPEDLERAMYDFVLESRAGGDMHQGSATAQLVEAVCFTTEKCAAMGIPPGIVPFGAWVGFKLDPVTFAKVRAGQRVAFSIQGTTARQEI